MIQAAFWLLAVVFAARLYLVARHNASSAFLGATGVGVVGLFCTGQIVPESTLDALIGGTNWLHLVRNLLVTAAVWLVREGVFSALSTEPEARRRVARRPLFLAALLLAITIPFTLQSFVPTTDAFIPETVQQPAVYVYATVYMAVLGGLGLSVLRVSIGPRDSRTVRASATVVGIGMGLMVLGCVDEIIYMSLRFLGFQGSITDVTYMLFTPLFYSGILLTSLGLGIPPMVRLWRRLALVDRFWILVLHCRFPAVRSTAQASKTRLSVAADVLGPRPAERLYTLVIAIGDLRAAGRQAAYSPPAERALVLAQRRLTNTFEPLGLELRKRAEI
ncbi:hypothetical protein HWD94_12900 [Pseudarthrobacter equi]|uniref:hypothetical protein n=1 Tax=Pseudarthrobacter TaxID=1742993 RepID=UPI001585124B|nr:MULTISPECIES: hypothetical protein [Pseudarthrobacter]MCT9626014.1 hypothetical protein [Pseudarthrobacter equi]NUT72133.1 hypothetical protein [Pseudarthrobacter sp. C4D7]